MGKVVLLENKRFGRLLVISKEGVKNGRCFWKCLCDCGYTCIIRGNNLQSGTTKSCGCLKSGKDLKGEIFGRWTVIKRASSFSGKSRSRSWSCICECGNAGDVTSSNLRLGLSLSCGCLQKEAAQKNLLGKKGALHPRYNPALTNKDREYRRHIDGYTDWRDGVFARDSYTCKVCNKRGGSLQAHHLDGWHWCKELRFESSNGVTLCTDCHSGFHKVYGYRDNTAEEFFEYFLIRNRIDG